MPKKVNKTENKDVVDAKVDAKNEVAKVENKEVAKVEVKKERKKREKKVAEATAPVQDTQDTTIADTTPKTRQTPTQDSVEKRLSELSRVIAEEEVKWRESAGEVKGFKFLNMLNKRIKLQRNHTMLI